MSTLEIQPATPSDFKTLFSILSLSFAHNHPFIESFYPLHSTPPGRIAGTSRLAAFATGDSNAYFVKCAQPDNTATSAEAAAPSSLSTSEAKLDPAILGFAKWNLWNVAEPEISEEQAAWSVANWNAAPWQNLEGEELKGDESELARWTLQAYLLLRMSARKASRGRLVSLDLMCIHPSHQRRGAGQALMQWGCQKADEMGVEAVVEASDEGKGLYERFGFKALRHVELRDGIERWHGRERQRFWWMVRPVRGEGSTSVALTEAARETGEGVVVDTGRL